MADRARRIRQRGLIVPPRFQRGLPVRPVQHSPRNRQAHQIRPRRNITGIRLKSRHRVSQIPGGRSSAIASRAHNRRRRRVVKLKLIGLVVEERIVAKPHPRRPARIESRIHLTNPRIVRRHAAIRLRPRMFRRGKGPLRHHRLPGLQPLSIRSAIPNFRLELQPVRPYRIRDRTHRHGSLRGWIAVIVMNLALQQVVNTALKINLHPGVVVCAAWTTLGFG